jgi:hypothetical protein
MLASIRTPKCRQRYLKSDSFAETIVAPKKATDARHSP